MLVTEISLVTKLFSAVGELAFTILNKNKHVKLYQFALKRFVRKNSL